MAASRRTSGTAVALCAALVLLLQSSLAAWAAATMAATPTRDAFGNALCLTGADRHDADLPAGHDRAVNCCTFGCAATPSMAGSPADGESWLLQPRLFAVLQGMRGTVRIERPEHGIARARAPPPHA